MASALLQDLSAAAALSASDLFYVKQGGARGLKATGTQLLALVGTAYVPLAGGTMTGALTIGSGTLTSSAPALNLTQTWNSGGTTFNALFLNVTDTASAAASLLADLQIGGVSKFSISKKGWITIPGPSSGSVYIGTYDDGGACFDFGVNSTTKLAFDIGYSGWILPAGTSFGWADGAATAGNFSVRLHRDAAATLALRNAANAQTFRAYNTYTDSSNGEWGTFGWVANELVIGTEKNGATSNRATKILSATDLKIHTSNGGNVYIGGNSTQVLVVQYNKTSTAYPLENTSYTQMTEMTAPGAGAANTVRIYAEDNGAGKTRLMAIFASGAAQQLAIEP